MRSKSDRNGHSWKEVADHHAGSEGVALGSGTQENPCGTTGGGVEWSGTLVISGPRLGEQVELVDIGSFRKRRGKYKYEWITRISQPNLAARRFRSGLNIKNHFVLQGGNCIK